MTVQAATDGERVLIHFAYTPRLVDLVHKVPGAHFHKPSKLWLAPLTMDTCRVLRRVFGDELVVMNSLSVWFRQEMASRAVIEEVRNGATPRLSRVEVEAPALAAALANRPYQLTGAAFINLGRNVLLGDQPGLGKTLQALAAIIESGAQRILVTCPRTTARTVWERETQRWTNIATFVAQGSRAEREKAMRDFDDMGGWPTGEVRRMLIINTEMVRVKKGYGITRNDTAVWPFLFEQEWDAIIFDESHQALASTKNVQSKSITQVRYGAMKLRKRLRPGGLALAMSGTPFRSDLTKAWGTLNWLRPDVFTSFWNFAKTHFNVEQGSYSMDVGKDPVDPEAFAAALRPYYLARDKQAAAPDLPPITYAGTPLPGESLDSPCYVQLDMEPEQAKVYEAMRKNAIANIEGGKLTAVGVLAEITRLRQFALSYGRLAEGKGDDGSTLFEPTLPSAKFDWILEFLRERQGNAGKVVIASSFTRWIKLLSAELAREGFMNLMLTGETSDAGRADLVKLFQDPDSDLNLVIINTKAGGVGITLDAADDMIMTDLPWKSDDERQVTDRIHRVSRIHNVTVYRLLSAGTVDIWMAGLTEEQRRILASGTGDNARAIAEGAMK